MGIKANKQGAIDTLFGAIEADSLGNSQDMPFIKRVVKRRAAVPRGAEGDALRGHAGVRHLCIVSRDKPGDIDQQRGGGWLPSQGLMRLD